MNLSLKTPARQVTQDTGDFLVVLCHQERQARMCDRLMNDPVSQVTTLQSPVFHSHADNAFAISWGNITVLEYSDVVFVGIFQATSSGTQRLRDVMPGIKRLLAGGSGRELEALHGSNYAFCILDRITGQVLAVTDAFRRIPLYMAETVDGLAFASDVRLLASTGLLRTGLDMESIYHYLNFSCIPAPYSIFKGASKIPAGTVVFADRGGNVRQEQYWHPRFTEDNDASGGQLETELRERLFDTVNSYRPDGDTHWGTFLSGGTDSSSITGILAASNRGKPIDTFSIGFSESGYDELEYARHAATQFKANPHFRIVSEEDAVNAIPAMARIYDEPFGNASAIPSLYCTGEAAAHKIQIMLAGDGGDEIFGGNERYAKDAVYRAYSRIPLSLRKSLSFLSQKIGNEKSRAGNRLRNFTQRGLLENPARFYSDDSFASDYFDELLSADFRNSVLPNSSLALLERAYSDAGSVHELHKLMYLDLMTAIADNDITKVHRAAKANGVAVSYPYLDPELANWMGSLPASWKVRGMNKRYLFKLATGKLLPRAILEKKKQGFGLPIADWLRRDGPFNEIVSDRLASQRFRECGFYEPGFIERLLDKHRHGSWDHSPELWRIFMLDLWLEDNVDAR
jgi:asparagine synthase (glutamine-hydrolysing)